MPSWNVTRLFPSLPAYVLHLQRPAFHLMTEDTGECAVRLRLPFCSKGRIPFLCLRVRPLWHPAATSKFQVWFSFECVMVATPANNRRWSPAPPNGDGMPSTHLQGLFREASHRKNVVKAGHNSFGAVWDFPLRCGSQFTFAFLLSWQNIYNFTLS